MTSTERLVAGVIAALLAPAARLYEMNAAFGVANVCVAFATTTEVMMATIVAMRMTPGREDFWIRILIAFIFVCVGFPTCGFLRLRFFVSHLGADFVWNPRQAGPVQSVSADADHPADRALE